MGFFEDMSRSDSLRWRRGIEPEPLSILGRQLLPVEVFLLVFDSSTIQKDLRWLAKRRAENPITPPLRTALLEAMDARVVVGLIPPNALVEIEKHLPTIAEQSKVPLETVRSAWTDYRERLLVFIPRGEGTNPELAARDASDLAFVAAMNEAAADALVTADKDLLDHVEGASTPRETGDILRAYARAKAISYAGQGQILIGMTALNLGTRVAHRALRSGVSFLRRLPPLGQLAMVVAGIWAAHRPEVRQWFGQMQDDVMAFGRAALPKVAQSMEAAAKGEAEANVARAKLEDHLRTARGRITLRATLLRVLARAEFGRTHGELARDVLDEGYRTTARDLTSTVLRRLRMDATFELKHGRWHSRLRAEIVEAWRSRSGLSFAAFRVPRAAEARGAARVT